MIFFKKSLTSITIFHAFYSKTLTEEERILKSCPELQRHQRQRHEHKSASATSCSDVLHNGLASRQFCFSSWEALYFVNFSLYGYPWLLTSRCYSWSCVDGVCASLLWSTFLCKAHGVIKTRGISEIYYNRNSEIWYNFSVAAGSNNKTFSFGLGFFFFFWRGESPFVLTQTKNK